MSIRFPIILSLLLGSPMLTHAQQAMEMYIPIGASVGVSQVSSIVGKVASVGKQGQSFTLGDAAGSATIAVPEGTPIWLDRSKVGGKNGVGTPVDIKEGATVEVKYREASRGAELTADWIKVEAPRYSPE